MDEAIALRDTTDEVEGLYRSDAPRLWRSLLAFAGGDADIADEAVAEAFAQALRRGGAVREPQAWIWRAAFRIAAGLLRDRRAQQPEASAGGPHLDRYADLDLIAALRRLPERQRAAIVLFYYADLPVAAIAARLNRNQLSVRADLSRGRRRLHTLLGSAR